MRLMARRAQRELPEDTRLFSAPGAFNAQSASEGALRDPTAVCVVFRHQSTALNFSPRKKVNEGASSRL